ncbi:hypothetical protein ACJX0J_007425, partial [Zea mays]
SLDDEVLTPNWFYLWHDKTTAFSGPCAEWLEIRRLNRMSSEPSPLGLELTSLLQPKKKDASEIAEQKQEKGRILKKPLRKLKEFTMKKSWDASPITSDLLLSKALKLQQENEDKKNEQLWKTWLPLDNILIYHPNLDEGYEDFPAFMLLRFYHIVFHNIFLAHCYLQGETDED